MPESASTKKAEVEWVEALEELFESDEYFAANKGRRVRIRICAAEDGSIEILADSPHTGSLDGLLEGVVPGVPIEKVPCG